MKYVSGIGSSLSIEHENLVPPNLTPPDLTIAKPAILRPLTPTALSRLAAPFVLLQAYFVLLEWWTQYLTNLHQQTCSNPAKKRLKMQTWSYFEIAKPSLVHDIFFS